MNITLRNIQYHPNGEPVALLMEHALGSLFLNTTQSALTARTVGGTGVWADGEALAEAQALLDIQYAGQGFIAVLPPVDA